ncbi:PQQ-binding-like beta-propeller repeat protein [Nocardia transvalensis]|uniref:outer membrane protein assembly factor BamB family protein n=1 Tax=Nocardia transvalensis TaxID=37333 RepID=UPI0018938303|nr:PQQ-binding-like beta-propeller repeat protein [Nocardia transvalensis]MBF6327702.1 PQQ-binding-like beta-propeller repeat protein [Nocardia transvalensis]
MSITARVARASIAAAVTVLLLAGAPAANSQNSSGNWTMWQFDLTGSRYNPHETAITPATVGSLRLKWAFAFPETIAASSQPAVVDGTVYVGGRNGTFYALDAETGATRWSFEAQKPLGGNVPTFGLRDGPAVANGLVYFGDAAAKLWALDAATGALRWVRQLDDHRYAIITSSPLVSDGRVYVGVSSQELGIATSDLYHCCTFRGSVVALDAATGDVQWKHYTIEQPQPTGGKPEFAPSGAPVWSSPTIDAQTRTLYYTSGNPYTGYPTGAEAIGALDIDTGTPRWIRRMTPGDPPWNGRCAVPPPGGNCPDPGHDFDFGSQANIFKIGDRTVVGAGQKSGVYHLLDAATGDIVWQTRLSTPTPVLPTSPGAESLQGIQWGASYDGQRLYVATYQAQPGTLFALNPATGEVLWATPNPADSCLIDPPPIPNLPLCQLAMPNAVSSTPGLVYEGSLDGKMRVFSAETGAILWEYNTARPYKTVNGVPGVGGGINGHGAVISNGMLFTNSGYGRQITTGMPGNVLLAFGLP